ncbi:MAG: CRTAC1 family protein [Planctomycetaceae bacterium]|nr:CRTAC1 family protein [Planctomycetaceae bacterium]
MTVVQPLSRREWLIVVLLVTCALSGCTDPPAADSEGTSGSRPDVSVSDHDAATNPSPLTSRPASNTTRSPPVSAATAITGPRPHFTMIGADSGFDFERFDNITGQRRIFETTGGGLAAFDFDQDGWLDVFLTNGCRMPAVEGDHEHPSAMIRNRGRMRFEQVTTSTGIAQFGFGQGCAVGDFDADGFDDLYVAAFHRNSLWKNNGDGTFTDVTDDNSTAVPVWSTSAAWGDLNDDGLLDLYVANYLEESDRSPRLCPNEQSPDGYQGCSPAVFHGLDDALLLNDGQQGFVDATAASGILGYRGKGLGVVIIDLDLDRRSEIYVANDGEANLLLTRRNTVESDAVEETLSSLQPQFENAAVQSGVALNEKGFAQASMGIAVGDYDANGFSDLYLAHFYGDTNTLYANRGDLEFAEQTRRSGLGTTSRQTLGFGTLFLDFDNDRWLDLFVANGHVDDRTWTTPGQPYFMRPQIYRNDRDGSFTEVTTVSGDYFQRDWLGRGVVSGDLDRDGRIDLAVSHQLAPSVILHNETPQAADAVTLRLVGRSSNRNGYGARVELVDASLLVVRQLCSGESFQSACAPEVSIGLGGEETAHLRITWPSGAVDEHTSVGPGHWVAMESGLLLPLPLETRQESSPAATVR